MVSEHNARLETAPVRKLKGYKFKGVGEEGRELKTLSKGGKTCQVVEVLKLWLQTQKQKSRTHQGNPGGKGKDYDTSTTVQP